jgi:hypothetical protein
MGQFPTSNLSMESEVYLKFRQFLVSVKKAMNKSVLGL